MEEIDVGEDKPRQVVSGQRSATSHYCISDAVTSPSLPRLVVHSALAYVATDRLLCSCCVVRASVCLSVCACGAGLVPYIPLEQFQTARLCVICNLKPSPLRGVTSYGMVLAASNADRSVVELIVPPASARVGERLTLGGLDVLQYEVDAVVDPKKKGTLTACPAMSLDSTAYRPTALRLICVDQHVQRGDGN